MKTVSIIFNDREIERFQLTKSTLFVGRSPTCDIILRAKSVRPVHFVIEWFGEGQFDPEKGMWSVIDISQSANKASSSGEGMILGSENIKFGGFQFRLVKDDLAQSHLKKGVLKRSVDLSLESENTTSMGMACLEVVSISNSLQTVDSVNHYDFHKKENISGLLKSLPRFSFSWAESHLGFLEGDSETSTFEVFNKNELVTQHGKSQGKIEVSDKDIMIIRSPDYDYYLRLVPKIKIVKPTHHEFDSTLLSISIIILILFLFSIIVPKLPDFPHDKVDEARVARVELYEPKPPEEEKKPIPELPEKPPEKVAQSDLPIPDEKPEQKPPEKKPPMAAPKVKTVEVQPKTVSAGLSVKAPVKSENKVGILGAIKANRSAGSKSTVRADQILADRPPSELETQGATTVVAKSKAGVLGTKTKDGGSQGTEKNSLEAASTTLKNSFVKNNNGQGVIAKTDGTSLEHGLPTSTGKNLKAGAAVGFDDGATTEVSGGLDKDAVRQAIRENQVQIRACYERALSESARKDFSGKISYFWKITPDGDVSESRLTHTDFKMATFENCVKRIIDRIIFPKAANRQPTFVKYPFFFQGKK